MVVSSLGEVSLAHDHLGLGALVGGYGVVQVQAAGGVLLEEGTDTLQVPLGLELQGLVLVELGFGPLHVRAVRLGVDDEQGLVLPDVGAFLEQYLLEVSLDPCTYLHELLGTDFSGVLTVYFHVVDDHGLRLDYRILRFGRLRPRKYDPRGNARHEHSEDDIPYPFRQSPYFPDSDGHSPAGPGKFLCRDVNLHNTAI